MEHNLLVGLSEPDISNSKSIGRCYDGTLNPMQWTKCIHRFKLDHSYSHTDIILLNGDIRSFCILDSDGTLNPKFHISSPSVADNIRLELYNLIFASYSEFTSDGVLKRTITHPYINAEWTGTVTTKIELCSTYQGNLTEEQKEILDNYKKEQDRIKAELEIIREEKKKKFKIASEFDVESLPNLPCIPSAAAPFIDSGDFYSKIKLNGINLKFNNFVVTHSYIDAIKAAFREFNPSRYDVDIKWRMNIENPVCYKYGVNQVSDDFYSKFYIYYNDDVIRGFFTSNMKLGKSLSWRLYYWSLGLLYINGKLNDDTNIDDVFYYMMCFIEKYFIQNNVHAIQEVNKANRNDIKIMSIEKLISNIRQYQREISVLEVLNFVRGKTKNGCLFPKGWSSEEKKKWKESHDIERQGRNDKGGKHMFKKGTNNQSRIGMKYKKKLDVELITRIINLKKDNKSFREISEILGIPKSNVMRLYNKVSSDLEL